MATDKQKNALFFQHRVLSNARKVIEHDVLAWADYSKFTRQILPPPAAITAPLTEHNFLLIVPFDVN